MSVRTFWTLRLVAAAGLSALHAASGLPAPAYIGTGVAVGEDVPTLAYAGAGTMRNGVYTTVYDNFGEDFHSLRPLDGLWNVGELDPWVSTNVFRRNWKPAITRRGIPTQTAVDLRTGYRCAWEVRPGAAAVSVPVGVACSSSQEQPQEHSGRALPTSPHHPSGKEPEGDATSSKFTTSLPPHLGEAAQLVRQTKSDVTDQQMDDPVLEDILDTRSAMDATAAHSRRRRQVSRQGRRGASSSAAAASASSGPWGSSASAAAASAASGGSRRPAYGYYRPGFYGRPAYGRPYQGVFYG